MLSFSVYFFVRSHCNCFH